MAGLREFCCFIFPFIALMLQCEAYNGCKFDPAKKLLNCQRLQSYKELMNHANAKETTTLLIEKSNIPFIPYNTFSRYQVLETLKIIGNKIGIIDNPDCKSAGRNCKTVAFLDNEVDYFGTCGMAVLCNCRNLTLRWKYGVKTNVSRDYLKASPSVYYLIEENSPMSHLEQDIFQGIKDEPQNGLNRYIVSHSTFSLGKSFLGKRNYIMKLEITYCKITHIHKDAFVGLERLRILSFKHSKFLVKLKLCPTLVSIVHLYLDDTGMTILDSSEFNCFRYFREFFVAHNALKSIDLSKLSIDKGFYAIGLHNCSLKVVPKLCDILKPTNTLYLYDNLIHTIKDSDFYCLTELRLLSLVRNPLKKIEVNSFRGNKRISRLYLNEVGTGELVIKIETLKGLMTKTSLRQLNVNCSMCQMVWVAKMHFAYHELKGYARLKEHYEVIRSMRCQGTLVLDRYKEYHKCVNAKVIKFGTWGECSNDCGDGESVRINTCSKGQHGGASCEELGLKRQTRVCKGVKCLGDGGWSLWSPWFSCTKVCGRGRQVRFRRCSNPAPSPRGRYCWNDYIESRECNQHACPVNGSWESWGRWSQCSQSCNSGLKFRTRTCTNPSSSGGGSHCKDNKKQTRTCNKMQCPVDGGFSKWQPWSVCTKSCSQGMRFRKRICDNPRPVGSGRDCVGEHLESRNCTITECKVYAFWTIWSSWTRCTKSCNGGHKIRYRICSAPAHVTHNASCKGTNLQRMVCHNHSCSEDGGWSSWTLLTCSSKCGIGVIRLERKCQNPTPKNGGKDCAGEKVKTMKCKDKFCKVDDTWSTWTVWSRCSATCSSGKQVRNRVCISLYPHLKMKKTCLGPKIQERICNSQVCSVYKRTAHWLPWTSWTACPKILIGAKQRRSRKCRNLIKSPLGALCPGEKEQIRRCNSDVQPYADINSHYFWTAWSRCTKSCGIGNSYRKLKCVKLSKAKGKGCVDSTTERKICNSFTCGVHGNWNKWSLWSHCSTTGGEVRISRIRNCSNPMPAGYGAYCLGHFIDYKICRSSISQDVRAWSQWGAWTPCDVTCDYGVQYRRRVCTRISSMVYSTRSCTGKSMDTKKCDSGRGCELEREWAAWGHFSSCDKTCSGGMKTRVRKCILKKSQTMASSCKGTANETIWCNIHLCPVSAPQNWLNWNSWSPCSKKCGNGTKSRYKHCYLGVFALGSNNCSGLRLQNTTCSDSPFCIDMIGEAAWEKIWTNPQKYTTAGRTTLEEILLKTAFGICFAWLILYIAIGIARCPSFGGGGKDVKINVPTPVHKQATQKKKSKVKERITVGHTDIAIKSESNRQNGSTLMDLASETVVSPSVYNQNALPEKGGINQEKHISKAKTEIVKSAIKTDTKSVKEKSGTSKNDVESDSDSDSGSGSGSGSDSSSVSDSATDTASDSDSEPYYDADSDTTSIYSQVDTE